MDKSHPLCTPIVVRTLDIDKGYFRPQENVEELLGLEIPYLSVIGALMYLTNYICPDIACAINLLSNI